MNTDFPHFEKAHVLVIGDVMLDRYWHGATERISPEAPVPVVHIQQIENKPGGAANVALNIAALQAQASLIGIIGHDEAGRILHDSLQNTQVKTFFLENNTFPTITKLRVLSLHQQLIRLDFEERAHHTVLADPIILMQHFDQALAGCQAIILSDYGKGTLRDSQQLIARARQKNLPVFVDPKGQDFARYRGATLVTPNKREFEAIVGTIHTEAEMLERGEKLCRDFDFQALLVTLGADGMVLIRPAQAPFYLTAHASEVFDVTGAGDTVIGVMASAVAAGATLEEAVTLANIAAGITVRKLGAATVSPAELRRELRSYQRADSRIVSEMELLALVEDAKAHGESIVMTNGCFDLLHPGHITYLEEAKNLGDRLIIAVNDDASVTRLKGPTRPINPLADRLAMLAALRSVDWVVPFSEDTPARLVELIAPDILVKGGDYAIAEIAGAAAVQARGGSVKTIDFVPNQSSSNIIAKIRGENA